MNHFSQHSHSIIITHILKIYIIDLWMRKTRDQKSTCLMVFNMPYLTEVFYKEWSAFNSEKNKSKAVEMVHIPVEAYLQVLFYHLNPLHPCIDKETCEKKVQSYATYFTKQAITMSYKY